MKFGQKLLSLFSQNFIFALTALFAITAVVAPPSICITDDPRKNEFRAGTCAEGPSPNRESPPSTPEHPSDARLVLKSLMNNNPCKDFNTFSRRLYKARAVGECVNAFKAMKLLKDELLIPECDDVDTIQCTESYLNWYCSGYITRKQPTTRGTEGGFCRSWWQGGSSTLKRERVWLTSCYNPDSKPSDYKRSQSEFQRSQSNFQRSQSDYQRSKSDYQRSQSRGSSGENGGLRLGPAMPSQRAPPRFKRHYLPWKAH